MKTSTGWALAAIAVLAMGSAHAAQAGSKTGGSAPTGFSSGGQHKGFETFSNTSTDSVRTTTTSTARLPGGWDQGKADWKEPLQQPNPTITTLPPGLSKH